MMLNLTETDTIAGLARRGRDPLGIGDTQDRDAIDAACTHAIAGVDMATALVLAGDIREAEARGEFHLKGLDTLTAALMAHHGADPLVLVWILLHQHENMVETVEDGRLSMRIDNNMSWELAENITSVEIARGVTWVPVRNIVIDEMPETIRQAVRGRPLRDVLSHPVLDPHPLVVDEIDEDDDLGIVLGCTNMWADVVDASVDHLIRLRPPNGARQ